MQYRQAILLKTVRDIIMYTSKRMISEAQFWDLENISNDKE